MPFNSLTPAFLEEININQSQTQKKINNKTKKTKFSDLIKEKSDTDSESNGNIKENYSGFMEEDEDEIHNFKKISDTNSKIANLSKNNNNNDKLTENYNNIEYNSENFYKNNFGNYDSNYTLNENEFNNHLNYLKQSVNDYSSENGSQSNNNNLNNKELLTKVNYIIHLLEEQRSEKTSYITEELILYLFLGVFIIFVLDSFSKASKYVR